MVTAMLHNNLNRVIKISYLIDGRGNTKCFVHAVCQFFYLKDVLDKNQPKNSYNY